MRAYLKLQLPFDNPDNSMARLEERPPTYRGLNYLKANGVK
jgi:hypothetical protein